MVSRIATEATSPGAVVQLAKGQAEAATQLMDEATEIAEGLWRPAGAANPIKPPYELYGEILLELDRPAEALDRFETSRAARSRLPSRW